jgi:segregation and condensation protein A
MQPEAFTLGPFDSAEAEKPVDLVELIYAPDWKTILYDLVQSEKMNAWDINITELAEKYYARIKNLTETSLRIPANAMLCSAILLRFKSKKLKISSIEEVEEAIAIQQALEAKNTKLYDKFEPLLKNPRLSREGKVSLNELVSAIEEMMEKTRQKALKKSLLAQEFKIPYASENIEEKSQKVMELVLNNCDSTGLCLFSHISIGKKASELVDLFIPMLFLCNKGKLMAWQEEWFGEIFIQIEKE